MGMFDDGISGGCRCFFFFGMFFFVLFVGFLCIIVVDGWVGVVFRAFGRVFGCFFWWI